MELSQIKAALRKMIGSNELHAGELAEMLPFLPGNARKYLQSAIGSFEAGNVELQQVLTALNAYESKSL